MRDLKQLRRKIEISFEPKQLVWMGIAVIILLVVSFYAGMFAARNTDVQTALAVAKADKQDRKTVPPKQQIAAASATPTTASTSTTTSTTAAGNGIDETIDAYSQLDKKSPDDTSRNGSSTADSSEDAAGVAANASADGASPKGDAAAVNGGKSGRDMSSDTVNTEVIDDLRGKKSVSPKSAPKRLIEGMPQYTLQIFSYKDEDVARKSLKRLKEKRIDAYTISKQIGGATWYRLRYGHYVKREEAEKDAAMLRARANLSSIVTKIGD